MKPLHKWVSVLGVAIAMLLLLCYMGVVNSRVSLGLALAIMAAVVLVSAVLIPPPKDKK